jgi:hypothetical protein
MPDPEDITGATQRLEQAQRLIREAQLARRKNEPLVQTAQDEIDGTHRVSDMMGHLAHLIDAMNDDPQFR